MKAVPCLKIVSTEKEIKVVAEKVNRLDKLMKDGFLFLDGAMGTMLQKAGLKLGERPEAICIEKPEIITDIHRQYVEAGSQIVYANTFGANRHKLEGTGLEVDKVIEAAVKCAKKIYTVKKIIRRKGQHSWRDDAGRGYKLAKVKWSYSK